MARSIRWLPSPNSLNQIKSSFLAVQQQVVSAATGAITEFPLYEISRADPSLYNLMTSALTGAKEDIAVSTKSCETMQSEIAQGGDPYSNWGQIALGNKWKMNIGDALLSGHGDINQAKYNVSHDAGKSGVPWVNPDASSSQLSAGQSTRAGGKNQPPIHVIHDTASSGYNVVVNDGQASSLQSGQVADNQSDLTKTWPTAKDAADWITNVVGDETITTYDGGEKKSKPGVGLYSDIQYQTKQIEPKLQALVTGSTPLTVENLQAVSPQGMALSPDLIHSIQDQSNVIKAILVDKLAQNLAAMTVINKARLAMRVLESGGKIPAIFNNKAAQKNIQDSISHLQQDVQDILMFVKARQTLMSNMLSTVVQAGQDNINNNTKIAVPNTNAPMIQNGAIKSQPTS